MAVSVRRLAASFGAEILGADLHQPPTSSLIDIVNAAVARHALVVVRDQLINDEEQVRFSSHEWRSGDFVIWDNRCTIHRATKYDVSSYKRDLRRTTINEYGPEISSTDSLGIPSPRP